jgi:transcriptional regulator with XRE-family HTH domain
MILKAVLKEMQDQQIRPCKLAEMAKVSRGQLAPWLKGKTKLNEINLLKILETLNLVIVKKYD